MPPEHPPRITPLTLHGIRLHFGRNVVLRGVDMVVDRGEIVGLLGANGAGKTSLLSIVTGLLPPSAGRVGLGDDVAGLLDARHRARMAYVAHTPQLYPLLTGRENLQLFAELLAAASVAVQAIEPLLERLGLADAADRPLGTYSRGMAQRLALARALLGNPELLVLDEPFTALDGVGRDLLGRMLQRERGHGTSVLLSSHDLEAVIEHADRALWLSDGVIVREVRRRDHAPDEYRTRISSFGHRA